MKRFILLTGIAGLAACSGTSASPADDGLARDLAAVGAASIELAPASAGTQVMSAIEQGERAPAATPAPSPRRERVAQAPVPRAPRQQTTRPRPEAVPQAPAPAREVVAESPVEAPQPVATSPTPSSQPLGAGPAPPGGWKSIGHVIRNSRVPINP